MKVFSAKELCAGHDTENDPAHPYAQEVRTRFLSESGTSEDYFSKYFTLLCAFDLPNGKHVVYHYKLQDYTFIVRFIRFAGSDRPFSVADYLPFHDVTKLIPFREAAEKLKSCLDSPIRSTFAQYIRGSYQLTGNSGKRSASLDLITGQCQILQQDDVLRPQ